MAESRRQAANHDEGRHLVLYDGVCGLCNRLLQFLFAHDHRAVFYFASLQSSIGQATVERWGGDPRDLSSFYVIADYRTANARALTKSRAALFVAREIGWPWKALGALGLLPTAVLDFVYDIIATHRYRIFGRSDTCLVPAPDVKKRFVE
jgi:predicted DCC family thiol-disulfide oxidoreductase YuxK